jgi:glutaredoxin
MTAQRNAVIYRIVMVDHVCPYGVKSLEMLQHEGFAVEDNHLKTREETDAFKQRHNVDSTPQTFIDGQRIGGYEDLFRYLGP